MLQFIDSTRFMASTLSNLVNNLSEVSHRVKCKFGHNDKNCETKLNISRICGICRIKYKYCDSFLECTNFKDDLTEYKCMCCNKKYQQKRLK